MTLPTREDNLVTVFGGSGFLGRHVVRALAERGWRVRNACRRPDLAGHLQPMGRTGQIHSVQANLRYPASVTAALREAKAVVNLVGLLSESGRQRFDAVHAFGAKIVAREAAAMGITNFVQISALGASEQSASAYARTKAQAEASVREHVPGAVILRPSVVFGPEDTFFNRFAAMSRFLPVLPLVGAETKFQPVFAGDVAEAVARALEGRAAPGTYELGGPDVVTLRQIVEFVCAQTHRKPLLLSLPFPAGRLMALGTEVASKASLGLFPPMLTTTRDQVSLLQSDNVVSPAAISDKRTLEGLGVLMPESFRTVVPSYLWRYRKTGQFEGQRLA